MKIAKYVHPTKIISLIFIGVSLLLICIAVPLLISGNIIKNNYDKVWAKISDIVYVRSSEDYDVLVDYTYNGNEYQKIKIDYYSSTLSVGDEIEIYLTDEKPTRPYTCISTIISGTILIGVGGLFFIISAVMIAFNLISSNNKKRLKAQGNKIYAKICDIFDDFSFTVNNRCVYKKIRCSYDDGYNVKYFQSGSIKNYETLNLGDSVAVYAEDGSQKYYIDIEDVSNF